MKVFQGFRPKIVELRVDLVLDVIIGSPGDQYAARLGQRLQAGRDVDALAVLWQSINVAACSMQPTWRHIDRRHYL